MRLRITSGDDYVILEFFTDDPNICVDVRPVVHVSAPSLPEAFQLGIQEFRNMQEQAVEELRRWELINFRAVLVKGEEAS